MSDAQSDLAELMAMQKEYELAREQFVMAKAAAKSCKEKMEEKSNQIIAFIRQLSEPNIFRKPEGEV